MVWGIWTGVDDMSEAICKKQKIRFLLGILVEADFFAGICLVFSLLFLFEEVGISVTPAGVRI